MKSVAAMPKVERIDEELISAWVVNAVLDGKSLVKEWREFCCLTQQQLAYAVLLRQLQHLRD